MARHLVDPSIEDRVQQRLRLTPDTIQRTHALAKKWEWGKAETFEFLVRCALVAHEKKS